jgi:hypothetical protein
MDNHNNTGETLMATTTCTDCAGTPCICTTDYSEYLVDAPTATSFKRELFSFHGGYLCYHADAKVVNGHPINDIATSRFVARFKYGRGSKARFLTFLIKNFTVEEYFARLEDGGEAPALILESKGYVRNAPKRKRRTKAEMMMARFASNKVTA